jgi:protein-tyrosine phosphatase
LPGAKAPVNGVPDRAVKVRGPAGANYDPTIDVAFICTGNICRSPMAEELLRARLSEAAPEVVVGSAGLLFDGRPAERHAVKALARLGLDLSGHRSQIVSAELLADTSVVIGMERQHLIELDKLDPELFARSFTLPELVRSVDVMGPRPEGVDLRSWVERSGSMRTLEDYLHRDPSSEIADPMGSSGRVFRSCADQIDQLLATFVDLAWPVSHPSDPAVAPATTGGIHADRDRR